jgi:hypothetical protein
METGETSQNGVLRDQPDPTPERSALVKKLLAEVKRDKEHWNPAFKQMRADKRFARKQLPNEVPNDERAKVNIIQRHLNQRKATLYAKNPRFVAERRPRLDYAVWDGKRSTLERAAAELDMAAKGGPPPAPETMQLMQDIQRAGAEQRLYDNIGKTMEVVLTYSVDEQQPPFKPQVKRAVLRTLTTGVGYAKLQYQRTLAKRPDSEAKLADITDRLANVERMRADQADGVADEYSEEIERLRLAEEALKAEQDIVVREGLVFGFPFSENVIPDRNCAQIAVGFPGARRVSERFLMTCDEIKEVYGVDIGTGAYTGYTMDKDGECVLSSDASTKKAMVFEVYDRKDGLKYVVCDGYGDFLEEPVAPDIGYIEPFFPYFPLIFNDLEDDENIFPESDVALLRSPQREINRKREGVRQHRIANRPLTVTRRGVLTEDEAKDLSSHPAHSVIELSGLSDGDQIDKVFAPFPKPGVDPNLYETATDISDVQMVVGSQEANLGGTGGDSATENSIAETSRLTSISSCIDDLDDWLSSIARAAGQVLLREMATETVTKIAGPGAVWPTLRAQDVAEEIFLKIEAGSSGRPNAAQDLANFERVAPTLVQLPGVNPEYLAKTLLKLVDSKVNYEEAITAGLPSITSMNRLAQPSTGDPATDPNAQGGEGADNAPNDDASTGGAQPSYQGEATAPGGGGAPA